MPQPVYSPWLASDSLSFKPFKARGYHEFACPLNHPKPMIAVELHIAWTAQSLWLVSDSLSFKPLKAYDWYGFVCPLNRWKLMVGNRLLMVETISNHVINM